MIPRLYARNETDFTHNGIGLLSDSISATVTEELNSTCELQLEYDVDGRFADQIADGMIIKAKANDKQDDQLFRIYKHVKDQDDNKITVYAQHITYDLAQNFVEALELDGATTAQAMQAIQSNLAYPTRFALLSDNTTTTSSTKLYRNNPLQMIAGADASILDNWGGEIERNNFNLIMRARRGTDDGVLVAYRKNLTGLTVTVDRSNLVTRIYPFKTLDDGTVLTIPGKYVDSTHINDYDHIYIQAIDYSSDADVTDQVSLEAKSAQWFTLNSGIDMPAITMEVAFEPLWATEEYKMVKMLELVGMGDTIYIKNSHLGIDGSARIIKIVYDVLAEKNAQVTAGDAKTSLEDKVSAISTVNTKADAALTLAGYAIANADGTTTIYSATEPVGNYKVGSLWFKLIDGTYSQMYRYDGIQWVLIRSQDANDALQTANQAQETADGKNKVWRQAAEPTEGMSVNDQWFRENADGTETAFKYDGTQWVNPLDDGVKAAQDQADAAVAQANIAVQDAVNAVNTSNSASSQAATAINTANAANTAAQAAQSTASDAATQAGTAYSNAQTAINNAASALNAANAANANANTREKSIIKSSTARSNPATDQLWIDTSSTPQLMKRWSGTAWITLSPIQASQIGAVSTTTYTTDISNINNTLSQKASVSTVNTLSGRVDDAETAIDQNAEAISLKADQTIVNTLQGTVDNHSTLIQQNADAIALKASQSSVDTLTGRVYTAESNITQSAQQIALRILTTDADAKYATQTSLTATSNSLTSIITNVKLSISANDEKIIDGSFEYGQAQLGNYCIITTEDCYSGSSCFKALTGASGASATNLNNYATIPVNAGDIFRVSFWVKASSDAVYDTGNTKVRIAKSDGSLLYALALPSTPPTVWTLVEQEFTIPAGITGIKISLPMQISAGYVYVDDVSVRNVTVQNSNGAQFSELSQTVDGLSTTVSQKVDISTYNTYVNQTATTLSAKLNSCDAASTYATQTSLIATSSSLTSQISTVQMNLNNLTIGYTNLIPNSTGALGAWSGTTIETLDGRQAIKFGTTTSTESLRSSSTFTVHQSTKYTITVYIKTSSNCKNTDVYFLGYKSTNAGSNFDYAHQAVTNQKSDSGLVKYIFSFVTNLDENRGYIRFDNNGSNDGAMAYTWFAEAKMEVGDKSTPWSPAPFDLATTSQITQLSSDINLRVQKNDVINQINISTESILIAGQKVHITGQTTIDNAVIQSAMIAALDAGKITTGTLNASRIGANTITSDKLNVANLAAISANLGTVTTGSLNSVSINSANITGTTISGTTITGSQINAESITSGIIDSARIAANSITADKIAIGDFTNYVHDPSPIGKDGWSGNLTNVTWVPNNGVPYFELRNTADVISSKVMNVHYGEKIMLFADLFNSGGLQGVQGGFRIVNADNGNDIAQPATNPNGHQTFIYTVEGGVSRIKFRYAVALTAGAIGIRNMGMKRTMSGDLIVDGTITGTNINGVNITGSYINAVGSSQGGSNGTDIVYMGQSPSNPPLRIYGNTNGAETKAYGGVTQWIQGPYYNLSSPATFVIANTSSGNSIWMNTDAIYMYTSNQQHVSINSGGDCYANHWYTWSTEDLKQDITELCYGQALSIVNDLDIRAYRYKAEVANGEMKVNYGPIISEYYSTPTEFLSANGKSTDDHSALYLAIKSIQELTSLHQQDILKIAELESRISLLEGAAA